VFGHRRLIPAQRYTGFVPSILESGKLRLSPEEVSGYRAAADRVHEACEMALDLTQPIGVEDWIFLEVAHAALAGDLGVVDGVVAKVEAEIESRGCAAA
jgi:hypothetical protein